MTDAAAARAPRRTGPARSLTRERVVAVAIDVMASQGLDAVSFRTVAMRLGVDPKALYTYVNDKDDLLAAMFDSILGQLDIPTADDPRPAADKIVDLFVSLRRVLIKNPDTFRLGRPLNVAGFDADAWERMAEALHELGWDTDVAVRVYGRLMRYTIGSAIWSHRPAVPGQPSEIPATAFDTDRHPHAVGLAETGSFIEDDASFAAALHVMLDQRIGES